MAKHMRGTNSGKGFYYEMRDGRFGWVRGMSKAEWDEMARKHGGFVKYEKVQ